MTIKEAEERSGVSRRNIRFYEQKGLLSPARNRDNDYREYSQEDIRTLKLIRALRMVDMPVENIREVVSGQVPLSRAAVKRKQELKEKIRELETAVRFCDELAADDLNIEEVLCRMDEPTNRKHLSAKWKKDYSNAVLRGAACIAAGLIPCFVGVIVSALNLSLGVISRQMSYAVCGFAAVLWCGCGYWFRTEEGRLLDGILIHGIPLAACVCYFWITCASGAEYGGFMYLFILGGYWTVVYSFLPFTLAAKLGDAGTVLPVILMMGSFLLGMLAAHLAKKREKKLPVGRILLCTAALLIVVMVAGFIAEPLDTSLTPEALQQCVSGEELRVEDGRQSYLLTGSEEFGSLFQFEMWERRYLATEGEPVLEVHLRDDLSEPYYIAFYADGKAGVYNSRVLIGECCFSVPEGLAEQILEFAQENGIPQ